jgi:glycosyltransferase involved in cell wall biosynthesis
LAKKSSAIIAISERQKQELYEEHKIALMQKISIVPLGFDLSKFSDHQFEKRRTFRAAYQIEEDEICIVIIGRLAPVKNHPLFFRAINFVKSNSRKKIRAVVVGDGNLRNELMQLCASLNLDTSYYPTNPKKATVVFTSWIQDVSYPLAGSDIVCLTSFNEGTPVSLIEAQAASKAIVTTKVGGIENSVNKEAAFLIDISDEKAFFEKLFLLCEDAELREKMALSGKDFVFNRFHYTRLVADVKRLYASLLKG